MRAARSRKDARAAQRDEVLATRAELLERAHQLEPERTRLAEAWEDIEEQWQTVGEALRGAEERLTTFDVQDAEDDREIQAALERLGGGGDAATLGSGRHG